VTQVPGRVRPVRCQDGLPSAVGRAEEQPAQPGQCSRPQPGYVHLGDAQPGGDLFLGGIVAKPQKEGPLLAAGKLVR
jgi:hypothetical protein